MEEFKETEIGLVPKSWQVKRVGEVYDFTSKPRVLNILENSNIPFIPMDLIPNQGIEVNKYHVKKGVDLTSGTYIEDGDFLLAKITPSFENGKQCIVNIAPFKWGYATTEVIPIKEKSGFSSKMFLFYYLLLKNIRELLAGKMEGSTGRQRLGKRTLENLIIPFPRFWEQTSIANILSLIQSAIQKQEQIVNTATELKNTLMKKLFNEGVKNETLKKTEIGMIPQSWEVIDLEKTGNVIYGIQAAVANNTKPIGTKILTNVNINLDGNINLTKTRYYQLKSKRDFNTILKKGDILFNWRSGSKEHVGKTALFNLDGEYIHSSFILRIRPNEKIDNEFLFYYLIQLRQSGYFLKMQDYSINAKFNKSAINKLPVAVPTLEEQRFISKAIGSANLKLEHHTKKLNNLKSLFQAMLYRLMTGNIRLKDSSLTHNLTDGEHVQPQKLSA